MDYVSRKSWGARKPRGRPSSISGVRGIGVHWNGPKMNISNHNQCVGKVRGIQNFHMNDNGWSDIAHSFIVCPHGIIYEGRGWGVRTAANGTNTGNRYYHAVCFLGGEGDPFTNQAQTGIRSVIDESRRRYGDQVRPHSWFKATSCPGSTIRNWISNGMNVGTSSTSSTSDDLRPGELGNDRAFTTESQVRERVADIRENCGLPVDPASDNVWVDRIVKNKSHHLGHARIEITRKAISELRSDLGLDEDADSDQVWVDRIAINGTRTINDAREALADKAGVSIPTPVSIPEPQKPRFSFRYSKLLKLNESGHAVKEWQEALRHWNSNSLPRFGPDNHFGKETDDWTRRYQSATEVSVDGIVGPDTRAAMTKTLN